MGQRVGSRALLLLLLAKTSTAWAEDSAARLDFGAPEGCPQKPEFAREVESRLAKGRLAQPGEMARTFHVRVKNEPDKSVAKLTFTDADGRIADREVSAATCEEAARAIALVTALAIDARAEAEQKAASSEAPAFGPPPTVVAPSPAPVRPSPDEPSARFGLGAEAGVSRGFAPGFAPRVAVLGEYEWARIGISYADSGPVDAAEGKARYRLYAARITAWPLGVALTESMNLGLGAGLDVGAVHAAGEKSSRIVTPKSTTRLWLSPEVGARFEIAPDRALAFHVDGMLGFPLIRHEFALEEPDTVVHEVPVVTGSVALGLVARFR